MPRLPAPPSPVRGIFIDESGQKEYRELGDAYGDQRGPSRYFVLGAVSGSARVLSDLIRRTRDHKSEFFGTHEVEIKSNWLRIPRERVARYLEAFGVSEAALLHWVHALYDLFLGADIEITAAVIDKVGMSRQYQDRRHPALRTAYMVLMQRVAMDSGLPASSVTVILDVMAPDHQAQLQAFHAALREGSGCLQGMDHTCLLPAPRFRDSAAHDLLQLADLVAYNVYRQFMVHGERWEEPTAVLPQYEYFERLRPRLRRGPDGQIQGYGVFKMPMGRRVRW